MADDLITQVPEDQNSLAMGNGFIKDKQNNTTEGAGSRSWCARLFCCLACKPPQHNNTTKQIHTNYETKPSQAPMLSNQRPLQATNSTNNNSSTNSTSSSSNNTSGGGGVSSLVTQVSQNQKLPPAVPQQSVAHRNNMPPPTKYLLPPLTPEEAHKKCLVLDLDETLVHSSFKPIPDADFVMTIELENVMHRVYVRKRPGVDHFMKVCGEKFEVIVFTASLAKYADPLLDILDKTQVVKGRLFREACVQHYGNYVKDLSHLGRRLEHTIIIDNSPFSYMFQPDNAIPISSWFHDKADRQLYELLPFLDSIIPVDDVCSILQRKRFQFAQQ